MCTPISAFPWLRPTIPSALPASSSRRSGSRLPAPASASGWDGCGRCWAIGEEATRWEPNGTQGWLALAEARERTADAPGALVAYRKIEALEEGPTGKIRAVGDFGDYRFGLAHQKLGDAARAGGDAATTRREYLAAACGFASTRTALRMFRETPISDLPDPQRAQRMRLDEIALWKWLGDDFAKQGDAARAAAARDMAADAAKPDIPL